MTNQLKRLITRSFLLLGLLGLAACGGDGGGNDTPPGTDPPGTNPPGTNPPPTGTTLAAAADAYTWLGNSRIVVPAANGLLANDTLATGAVPVQYLSAQGGTTIVAADGGFTYEPPLAFVGTDTFTYTATGAGGATATGTVTITINQKAWYVKNDGGAGQGTAGSPYNTLSVAMGVAGPNDIIFVFTGDGTTNRQNGTILLRPGQKLIGQGVGLTFDVLPANATNPPLPITGVTPTTALPLTPPMLTHTAVFAGNVPVITLADNVEVAGFTIDGAAAVSSLMGMSGAAVGFNIHDNTIRNLPKAAIQLLGATGGTGMIVNNTLQNILGANPDNAIDIVTTAAGVDFTLTGNTLNNILDSGIRVQFGSGKVVVSNNTLTNVGTLVGGGGRGIDLDGTGTITISGNTVDNTGGAAIDRSGIQVNARGTLAASVTGNTVANAAPADGGIQAQTAIPTGSLCLRMTGNTAANNFILDNRTTGNAPTNFRIEGPLQTNFETANTGTFSYLLTPAAVSFVPVGTCGFAP